MKRWGLSFVVVISACLILSVGLARADSGLDWFSVSRNPSLSLAEESATPPARDYWGADCRDISYKASWIDGLGKQITQDVSNCIHQASYGYIGAYGARLSGTQTSYSIKSQTGSAVSAYVVPGSKNVMTFSQTGSTYYKYIYIYKDLPGNIESVKDSNGSNKYYKLTKSHDGVDNRAKFTDGTAVIIQDQTPVYSADGRYIFANFGRAQTLIDTQSNSARIIGQNTNPSSGAPKVTLAINGDASLGFVANNSNGNYTLYKTVGCAANTNKSNPEQCQSRNLTDFIHNQVPNIKSILRANFLGDQKLELYISHTVNGATRNDRYILYQPGFSEVGFSYLGLGDSFASGEGASDYIDITDSDTNHCHISDNSYPNLLSSALNFEKAQLVACSGGKIKDVHKNIEIEYFEDKPQASGRVEDSYDEEIFTNFLPGYRRQWEFVSKYQPETVTLSIGGNDINFGKKLQYCILTQYSCYESAEQKNGILKELKAQFPNLVKTYTDLKDASPNTRIYIVGYPKLVQPGGDCALNVHLSSAELMLADEIVEDLNTVVKRAAQSAGVFYVDASNSFLGHKLCEDKSWNLAVNGLTYGEDKPFSFGPISNATFHPNKLGHQLFKSTILSHTDNLTESMPAPDSSISVIDMPSRLNPTGLDLGDAPTPILDDGLFGELIKAGDSIVSTISSAGYFLSKGDNFSVELHSTPQTIGTAIASGSDSLSIDAQIPDGVEPGPHEIHIYGKNIAGEPIDIYKNVLLIASDDDYDGDGIANSQDQCTFVVPSGADSDHDSVDDACDSEILEAPPVVDPPPEEDDTRVPIGVPEPPITEDTTGENSNDLDDSVNSVVVDDNIPPLVTAKIAQAPSSEETTTPTPSNQLLAPVNNSAINQGPGEAVKENSGTEPNQPIQNKDTSWYKTALIFLTGTPIGIAIVLLLDL